MKITNLWEELSGLTANKGSYVIRRYSVEGAPDIYVSVKTSTREKGIAISIPSAIQCDIARYSDLKDLSIEKAPDPFKSQNSLVLLLLSNPEHIEVFATLCTDLIHELNQAETDSELVKKMFNRLEKWKALFERIGAEGLSPEAQRGLFGELYFLRNWIFKSSDRYRCVKAWVGPDQEIRDFQIEDWAVEVKTTHGKNHQKISIASERQLDPTTLKTLFLFHLAIEVQQSNGETLNDLVSSIQNALIEDYSTYVLFRRKLLSAGYFDHHTPSYADTGYHIRQSSCYNVRDNFPRIEERDIRPGVGDVKYTIIVSDCEEYLVKEEFIFEIIA